MEFVVPFLVIGFIGGIFLATLSLIYRAGAWMIARGEAAQERRDK